LQFRILLGPAPAARGDNLGSITAALLRLLDLYGAAELEAAIGEALARGVPHLTQRLLRALAEQRQFKLAHPPLHAEQPQIPLDQKSNSGILFI